MAGLPEACNYCGRQLKTDGIYVLSAYEEYNIIVQAAVRKWWYLEELLRGAEGIGIEDDVELNFEEPPFRQYLTAVEEIMASALDSALKIKGLLGSWSDGVESLEERINELFSTQVTEGVVGDLMTTLMEAYTVVQGKKRDILVDYIRGKEFLLPITGMREYCPACTSRKAGTRNENILSFEPYKYDPSNLPPKSFDLITKFTPTMMAEFDIDPGEKMDQGDNEEVIVQECPDQPSPAQTCDDDDDDDVILVRVICPEQPSHVTDSETCECDVDKDEQDDDNDDDVILLGAMFPGMSSHATGSEVMDEEPINITSDSE